VKVALLLGLLLVLTGTGVALPVEVPWEPSPAERAIVPQEVETYGESSLLGSIVELSLAAYKYTLADQQGDICAFYPSCSEYAEQALDSCGLVLGLLMIADRLERCNWTSMNYAPRYYTPATIVGKVVLRDPVRRNCLKREARE
jgi:putative component of membrane protein insertase Oxa1/YidC/SpoIIIJ protein YidD